uniref:asparagine synthase (glutamine-hydrolyzing) n=1 Tax=viral metagenome TaxID=1070528 RepID=A0A6C0DIU3_9ZZZZ
MCGIYCRIGCNRDPVDITPWVKQLVPRGPEGTRIVHMADNVSFGFTRLAINGLTDAGMQPYVKGQISWICNGEIYNSKELEKSLGMETTGSDCECIGELYLRHRNDLVTFARALDGVFALALYDNDMKRLVVLRDPFGVRPLFIGFRPNMSTSLAQVNNLPVPFYKGTFDTFVFASELKAIVPYFEHVAAFNPGTIQTYDLKTMTLGLDLRYHTVGWMLNPIYSSVNLIGIVQAKDAIRFSLEEAVKKRLLTERPIACLLSGGLDSSLIAALVQNNLRELDLPPLKTFSIGFEGSSDLKHAKIVADWIGSDHTEIKMTPDEFFDAIPSVIKAIESYDTTTVRASTGNYLIAKKIRELTDCKVVFNGDGSDELFGGYLYFNNAPNDQEFQAECERLLNDIHTFDVLRSDRSISANGLEARTPFLDKQFVSVVRSIHPSYLRPIPGKQVEKFILRSAFDDGTTLPNEVLWRRKEAFSDGVSTPEKAWFEEIQERVLARVPQDWKEKSILSYSHHMLPRTPEEFYYRYLFTTSYGLSAIRVTVPYRWMPKWCPETNDPSARTLQMYNQGQTATQ